LGKCILNGFGFEFWLVFGKKNLEGWAVLLFIWSLHWRRGFTLALLKQIERFFKSPQNFTYREPIHCHLGGIQTSEFFLKRWKHAVSLQNPEYQNLESLKSRRTINIKALIIISSSPIQSQILFFWNFQGMLFQENALQGKFLLKIIFCELRRAF
jgi:hypothetical protein